MTGGERYERGRRIAVVGIGCRLPGARDHHEFYANLRQGVSSIRVITPDRWDVDEFYSPDVAAPNRSISKWCGLIDSPYAFDHAFFRVSPREAELMDPQQRILLEQSWRCIEDSGSSLSDLRRARTSVFVGVMARDHLQLVSNPSGVVESHSAIGAYDCLLANRLSHTLGLHGASMSVDAACAASLVAIHLGAGALLHDEADYVLAGGVSLNLFPWKYISFSKARMLSPRGLCRTFDRTADGYVPGDGAAMVLLRRLGDAVRDGDHIYGLIAGSAVNHSGQRITITAPTVESQREVIQAAMDCAGFDPRTVSYVEAHGTGTSLGDPIEVQALRQVFSSSIVDRPWCTLGSVKPNIGHLEAAAGIAGLIKVLMMLRQRRIPPSIHLESLNPLIDLSAGPFRLTKAEQCWDPAPGARYPLRSGVSSFGMGGVNSHVCVEEYRPGRRRRPKRASSDEPTRYPLLLSARTPEALDRLIGRWRELPQLANAADVANVCGTLGRAREHLPVRVGVLVGNGDDVTAALAAARAPAVTESDGAWWLRVGELSLPEPAQLAGLFSRGLFATLAHSAVDEDASAVQVLRQLIGGRRGTDEACLFTYLIVHFFLRLGLRSPLVTATGVGLWPVLAAVGSIDLRRAIDLAGSRDVPLRLSAPTIAFRGSAPEQVIRPWTLDEAYLTQLIDSAQVTTTEFAAVRARAASLITQHTYRANLQEWHQALRARGLGRLQVPLEEPTLAALQMGSARDTLAQVLAMHHAADRLDSKWSLPRSRIVRDSHVRELLDLLLDGFCQPNDLLAFAYGGAQERLRAAQSAQRRIDERSVDRERYPMLARHSTERARAGDTTAWLNQLRDAGPVLPVPAEDVATLDVMDAPLATCSQRTVTVTGASSMADAGARPLLDLWLLGVDIDWDLFWSEHRIRKTPLPTYEFDRIEHRRERPAAAPGAAGTPRSELIEVTTHWSASDEREPAHTAIDPAAPVLIVITRDADASVKAAARAGLGAALIFVTADSPAAADDRAQQRVRPTDPGDWARLVETLAEEQRLPDRIIVLTPAAAPVADDASTLDDDMTSVFLLAQALLRLPDTKPVRILHVQPDGTQRPRPEWTSLTGLAACLQYESSLLRLTCVLADRGAHDASMWSALHAELSRADHPFTVRYERDQRQVRRYAAAPANAPARPAAGTGVRNGGVYLVTGGAGGLGRRLAVHLLATPGVRVALAGRSPAPPELVRGIAAEAGAETERVLFYQADVTRLDDLQNLVSRIRTAFGPLNGVFHAAGVLRDRLLINKSLADLNEVLAPKVRGVRNLDDATRDEPLDFFALFSSVVAVIGNLGQSDYAVANAFLAEFAEQRESWRAAGHRNGRTVTVDWPLWDTDGMTVPDVGESVFRPARGLFPMPADIGLSVLDEAIGSEGRRTYLFGDPQRAVALLPGSVDPPPRPESPTQPSSSPSSRPAAAPEPSPVVRRDALTYVRSLFAELLHVSADDLQADLGFDQYGIDSIFIAQCNARLEQDLGQIPSTLVFECRTLNQLAERLSRLYPGRLAMPAGPAEQPPPASLDRSAARVRTADPATADAVAVIGLAGRYPMAPDVATLWRNLSAGRDCISEIPLSRWDYRQHYADGSSAVADGQMYCKWGGFLDDVDLFDPLFFKIAPHDAELMDPQERVFLQVAWHTFEDAGYPPYRLGDPTRHGDRAVGVFVGVTTQSYLLWGPDQHRAGHRGIPTSTPWSIANRVSYFLDLHGPSMPVDTACASSLSAIHLACASLARGECRMALVGGVNLYLHPSKYEWLCQMQMLSATGRCHAFGEQADGIVPGEGVGAVLLKPFAAAIADGDKILGIIRGTAVNHGGRTNGFTVPSPTAQAELARSALLQAGVTPGSVSYIEAHGTGTALGDPIEIAGLVKSYGAAEVEGEPTLAAATECAIGSIKTNIGHLESAAGIAGLTKVLLQMRHRTLVPSLHAERTNPRIDLGATRFRVQRELARWSAPVRSGTDGEAIPRRAGISSFGVGGANAHVVVEEFPSRAESQEIPGEHLVTVSARDAERLRAVCANLAAYLRDTSDVTLAEVAYQLQVRREPLQERCAILVSSMRELVDRLAAVAADQPVGDRCWRGDPASRRRRSTQEDTGSQQVAEALADRDLPRLASLWTAGADIAWDALYSAPLRHIELPGYPFARERYWLPVATTPIVQSRHPFLGVGGEDGSGTTFTGTEFFLADHRINGVPIFPAVGYLEMVRAALETNPPHGRTGHVIRFRTNVWSSPITVPDPVTVHIDLSANGHDAAGYVVHSAGPHGERVVHAEGKAEFGTRSGHLGEAVDLAALQQGCPTEIDITEFYARVHRRGLQLGPSYQAIKRLHVGADEALSEIRLPDHLLSDADRFTLHPSVFDAALQASLWLAGRRQDGGQLPLPFTIGKVELAAATPRRCFAHVVLRSSTTAAYKLDVRVIDEHGRVFLHVHDLWLRHWQPASRSTPPATDASPAASASALDGTSGDTPDEGSFFRLSWDDAPAKATAGTPFAAPLVMFVPTQAAGRTLVAAMPVGSGQSRRAVVTPGSTFRACGDQIDVRPSSTEDFDALLAHIGTAPRTIVYAWPRTPCNKDPMTLSDQLDDGLRPLFRLVRAVLASKIPGPVRLLCVVPSAETEQPAYAALAGFLRTAGRENPRLSWRLLEIESNVLANFGAGWPGPAEQLLWTELVDAWDDDLRVRYRGGRRLAWRWSRVEIPDCPTPLRRDGVYLISGGAGGLGLRVVRHLASRFQARTVLVGRSEMDERIASALASVGDSGGEAQYLVADVSQADGAAMAVDAARTAYGTVHGVVHCSGVIRDDYLIRAQLSDVDSVLAPKIWGAVHLDHATRDLPLDFFALFSSIAGPLGTVAQAGYAYANSFLDAFAVWRDERRKAAVRSGVTISMCWPLWQDGGMRVDHEVERALYTTFSLRPLSTAAGLRAFDAMLTAPAGPVLFVPGDGRAVAAQLGISHDDETQDLTDGATTTAGELSVVDHVRAIVLDEVAATVKIDASRIDDTADIGSYGFDSLKFSRLANQLNARLGVDITPAVFFEYTSAAEVVNHLVDTFPDQASKSAAATAQASAPVLAPATGSQDHRGEPVADPAPASRPATTASVGERESTWSSPVSPREPIAIIGMHGMMPQSADLNEFWEHLSAGRDLVTEIPSDRWDWREYFGDPHTERNRTNSKWGGFVPDIDRFDARFFGISPREAQLMDPQQRLFLQTTYRAVEEAGYRPTDLAKVRTGVYVGVATHDYYELLREAGVPIEAYTTTGLFHAILANRVSYLLNLNGPSFPIDTACSSSLVAVRSAVEALWSGSCDIAIAGGVNLLLAPMIYISFARAGMLSPTGRCRTFDAGADGYVRGEGVGALLLKPLSRATADGDHIHAVIRGSAVNHGGRVNTLTTPNPSAQAQLIVRAFEEGGVDPATVGYIEMHGTGTALGDPIEINGLKRAFRELRGRAGLPRLTEPQTLVGSVKSNIGHLEAAAGMAGIFKVILAMKHGLIPGNLHINEVNPQIQLDGSPLRIARASQPWPRPRDPAGNERPRRAGISSSGFGGVNAHVVLEEHLEPDPEPGPEPDDCQRVFVLSARTPEQLRQYAELLVDYVRCAGPSDDGGSAPTPDECVGLREVVAELLNVRPSDVSVDEALEDLGLGPAHLAHLRDWLREASNGVTVEVHLRQTVASLAAELSNAAAVAGDQAAGTVTCGRPRLSLRDLAFTLQVGREPMTHRLAVVATSAAALADGLDHYAQNGKCNQLTFYGVVETRGAGDLSSDDPVRLAQRWVNGGNVDWARRYDAPRPRRLSLPTYPFASTRYWLPDTEDREAPAVGAAALEAPEPEAAKPPPSSVATRRLLATDALVAHHRVHGRAVFPGVGHLEVARAAASGGRAGRSQITGAVWLRPLAVTDEYRDLQITMATADGRTTYRIEAIEDGSIATFSEGSWQAVAPAEPEPPLVDLAGVRQRCPQRLAANDVYERFARLGLEYGPLFRGIREAWLGQKEGLAHVALNPHAPTEPSALHPTLMDAALQLITVLDFASTQPQATTRLPLSVESVKFLRSLPESGFAHAKALGEDGYDVTLLDETGRPCVVFREVTVRPIRQTPERFFFRPYWTAEPVAGPSGGESPIGETLILQAGRALDFPRAIATRTGRSAPWILRLGERTRRIDDRTWEVDPGDSDAPTECVRPCAAISDVWFLAGLADAADGPMPAVAPPTDPAVALYGLIRALATTDHMQYVQALRIVINDVQDVDGRRISNPAAGGLVGFAKSVAKEYPRMAVTCVDIGVPADGDLSDIERSRLVDALLAEPPHRDSREVVFHRGRRYVKQLQPVELSTSVGSAFRRHGVYLIIGGATGIGSALARHLASTVRARLVLVGRHATNSEILAEMRHLASLGANEVMYESADVADPARMRDVLKTIRTRFGVVNGVVHAGMVLRDGILERLDADAFRAVLRPKVDGSRALVQSLATEPLDFLLFLSSVQSFAGSAGQSNYAAASTAQDAIARWAAWQCEYPVRVINWGYWGTVGSVANDEYRRAMAARGYRSISPADGMAAIEGVLASDERQVVVISADDRVLTSIGVRPQTTQSPDGTSAPLVAPLASSVDDEAELRCFEELICFRVLHTMHRLGLFRQVGQHHRREALLRESGCVPKYSRLLHALVALLVQRGFLVDRAAGVAATSRATVEDLRPGSLAEREAELHSRFPNLRPRLELAVSCLTRLRDVLVGELSGPEVLFPGGSAAAVSRIYRGERLVDYCNSLVADQTRAHLLRRAAEGAPDTLRLVEIGAGTGGTTRAVLHALESLDTAVAYDYTDVSARLVREAEGQLTHTPVRVRFRELDIEREIEAQAFAPGSYDVVIAANVLHATRNLDAALTRTRDLLVLGGRLILTEVTRKLLFHTVTFGLLESWWHYEDEHRRLAGSPLLDEEMWRLRLEFAGFADVTFLGTTTGQERLSQRVIVATAGGVRHAPAVAGPAPSRARDAQPAVAVADGTSLGDQNTFRQHVQKLIVDLTAECLNMPADEVDTRVAFASFGVDSIVAVELINKINTELGIVLKTVVIFDYPNVKALTTFILDRGGAALAGRFGAAPAPASPPPPATAPSVPPAGAISARPEPPSPVPSATAKDTRDDHTAFTATASIRRKTGFAAVCFARPGDPRDLRIVEMEPAAPGAGEIEVLVRAFPINFSDFLAAKGLYPMMPEFPFTPGVEVSGIVRRVGQGVTRLVVGDEVIALMRAEMGGQASVVITDENLAVHKPAALSHEEACGLPVAFLAMNLAMERAAVQRGERVFIPSATGTNGLMAVQLARQLGAEVIATAGSPRKVEFLARMGIANAIDHRQADAAAEILRRTGGRGVDVVINTQADGALQTGLNLLAPDGRYVEIAVFGLRAAGQVDLSHLVDNQSFISLNTKKYLMAHRARRLDQLQKMVTHLESGAIRPHVARAFTFDQISAAYAAKADRETIGRIVVSMPEPTVHTRDTSIVTHSSSSTVDDSRSAGAWDIAIIGMSGRFPGADDVSQLWRNLANGVSAVREVPASRWEPTRFFDPDPTRLDTTYCKTGGFLDEVDRFDAAFFNISGKESAQMDPQQRLFLEESWRALEDAGYPSSALDGRRCGVFVGAGPSEYLTRMNKAATIKEAQAFWGNEASVLAARISYRLNLRGPSIAVNTACSSSLVALHLACQSIRTGECQMAIAGGVFLMLAPDYFIVASNGNMLAPDGRCKTFDDAADGFGPGEGVGALVLKPLADALSDGDHIYGVIKGSAINQDGATNGITAPSGLAQTEVEFAAYERAGINADTISYVEAHGTGTPLGDPIEIEALTAGFRRYTQRRQYCAIGSIKTNIGHTAAAAGIAGVIKVLLALQHRQIPASLNFTKPNQHIDFADTPFYVNTTLQEWVAPMGQPRRAAVSSFGFSGTNAHLVIEEAPSRSPRSSTVHSPAMVPLSARTVTALRSGMLRLADWIAEVSGPTLQEVAYNLQMFRDHFTERAVFVANDLSDLERQLRMAAAGDAPRTPTSAEPNASELIERYLAGEEVDWESLWYGGKHGRIPLPTYVFDRTRHWFTEHDTVYANDPGREPPPLPKADGDLRSLLHRLRAGDISEREAEAELEAILGD